MFDKCLNHEFTANDIMANALFLLNRNDISFNFRVPLFAIWKYRGFKILAYAIAPIEGKCTLEHGLMNDGTLISLADITPLQ